MEKILAIDDKMDNLITLSALLKNLMPGCTMILSQSGMDGIEKAKNEQPDVILMDVKMPDMDGFETCRRLKNSDRTKHIPVIMVTAIKTDSQSRIRGLDLGADAFISKPIEEAELVSQVKVALRIKRAEDALRKEKDSLEQVVAERTRMLRESEAKYRSMMESITDPLWICSQNLTIEYMNPAMVKHIGRDVTGEKCYQVMRRQDYKCDWCVFDKVAQGNTVETTIKSIHADKTFLVTNMPIQHPDETVSKMSICRDITEYLTAVAEKDKAQTQLLQLQKMESIGTLAGGIAHDFNNILYPIIGFAEMSLEELSENHPIKENLEDILQGAKRARDLVKQILAFSSQKDAEYKPIRLQPVIKEALKLLRSTIPANIDIQHELDEDSDCILGDTTEVHEIVMNLCTNAYHAMEETNGTLKVSLNKARPDEKLNLPPKEYYCLRISDTGTGISPEIIDNIFDPYFTTKGIGKGSGLGLSVIHGIVKDYNGAITVESEPGKGTLFSIFLPSTSRTKTSDDMPAKNKETNRGNERILFVDDEEAIVKLGVRILEKLGYEVTGKTSCIEALALFGSDPERFDLVLTDMAMPSMVGTEFAGKLMEIRPDIPIIICTGFSERLDQEKAKAIGIRDYLHKPILINDLSSKVREVLDSAKKD